MQRWAKFVGRTAPWWIAAWPVVALGIWLPAPRIPTLLADDATGFFAPDLPSQVGFDRLKAEFPEHAPASRAVVIFVREDGLSDEDHRIMARVASALADRSDELGWQVSATSISPHLRPLLESDDGCAAVIAVDLPAELLTHNTVNRVRVIRQIVAEETRSSGLEVHVTGTGALGELLDRNAKRDIDRTTGWAFAAVTVILLLIYRSPVAMLLPMVTIGLSLMVALGIVGWAASSFLPVNGLVEMFIVVILVGSGVDYCLFLFARFREEMTGHDDVPRAVEVAVSRSGAAILASAGTNAAALATMLLADNRDLYTSGPTIAFAICIATTAVLTLTPSLMRVVGAHLLWPVSMRHGHGANGKMWARVARLVTRRPAVPVVGILLVLLPLAVIGSHVEALYDAYEEYPPESSFVRGARLYREHFFGAKPVSTLTLILSADARLDDPETLPALRRAIDEMARSLAGRFPIVFQRDLQDPLGQRRGTAEAEKSGPSAGTGQLLDRFSESAALRFYIGRTGQATGLDLGFRAEPRSPVAMRMAREIKDAARATLRNGPLAEVIDTHSLRVDATGETPMYADLRDLRERDFAVVAIAAVIVVYLILVALIRSFIESFILVAATLLTYLATYGATWFLFRQLYGVSGLSYQIDFLLFIIILSLGQDYNIYLVSRIHEEAVGRTPSDAVAMAVHRTGQVVSSCGIIMAAAFASMFSGSLLVMKEFAVALASGILVDTFVIRPLFVPALILLLYRGRGESSRFSGGRPESQLHGAGR